MYPHFSVLLDECVQAFEGKKLKIFVDGTLGAGGHAEAILEAHPEIELFIGIDQDQSTFLLTKERLKKWENKIKFIHANFEELDLILKKLKLKTIDGIILDLGVSSMQLDQAEKGFSFMKEGPLDMRMNNQSNQTAADLIANLTETELGKIFRDYGEEKQWRFAARLIVKARAEKEITTTKELVNILQPLQKFHKKGIHFATLIFQALRIAVNRELLVLEKILPVIVETLSSGSRACIISFHSLEDRIIKNYFRYEASDKEDTSGIGGVFLDKQPRVTLVTKKPIAPSSQEMEKNPRSRSSKLRIIQKI